MSALLGIGVGAVGHAGIRGRHELLPLAERHAWCAANDHPGSTFNPWQARAWCLCGEVIRDGDAVAWPKATDCGGPLVTCHHT